MQIRPKVHRPPSPPNQRLLRRTSELLTRWGNCRGHYVCLKVRADVKNVQKCERYLEKDFVLPCLFKKCTELTQLDSFLSSCSELRCAMRTRDTHDTHDTHDSDTRC